MSLTSSEKVLLDGKKQQETGQLNFYDCLKPLHMISKVFGLLPFTIHLSPNGWIERADIGVFNAAWFIFSIAINLVFAYFAQISPRGNANAESAVAVFTDRFVWILQLLMCLSSIILCMLNRNRYLRILRQFIVFDKNVKRNFDFNRKIDQKILAIYSSFPQMETFGVLTNFERIKRRISLGCVFWTTMITCVVLGAYIRFKSRYKTESLCRELELIFHYFSYLTQNNVHICDVRGFQILLNALRSRYLHMNNLLK